MSKIDILYTLTEDSDSASVIYDLLLEENWADPCPTPIPSWLINRSHKTSRMNQLQWSGLSWSSTCAYYYVVDVVEVVEPVSRWGGSFYSRRF